MFSDKKFEDLENLGVIFYDVVGGYYLVVVVFWVEVLSKTNCVTDGKSFCVICPFFFSWL